MKKLLTMIFLSMILSFNLAAYEDEYITEEYTVPMGLSVGVGLNYGGFTGDTGDMMDPGFGLSIAVGYRLSLSLSVYLEYLQNFVEPEGGSDDYDFYVAQFNLGVNFYFMPTSKLQPFVTGGFGNFHLGVTRKGDTEDLNTDNDQQTIFLGGGIEYALNEHMTIPVKVQWSKIITEDGENTSKDSIYNFVVGFNYYF